jgi:AGZA family xanthine/uracil permease-like MFS transporter
MDKFFKIKERGSTVRTEIAGGLTTFFAMAYIMFVNPTTMGAMNPELQPSIFTATCIAAAVGTLLTALLANAPFAQAPGMGLNAFFAFTVATAGLGFGMGYTFNQGLTIVLLSGVLFLIIAVTPLRGKIIAAIPATLKAAISGGIGLFIAFIGFLSVDIIKLDEANKITGLNIASAGAVNANAIYALIGFVIMAALLAWNVKGAIFLSIIATTILYYAVPAITDFAAFQAMMPEKILDYSRLTLSDTLFKFSFDGLLDNGILALVTAIISFLLVDLFDTVGTLVGTADANNMLDKNGNLPGMDKAIVADAVATCCGALLGTSTVTTYVESSTGISQGARTGLSSLVVSVLFILALIFAPIAGLIPAAATAPALIMVGVFMLKNMAKIAWDNMEEAIPAFLTIAIMPFGYSISDGIAYGFISYVLLKVVRGKAKQVPLLLYIISLLFVLMYVLKAFV